MDDIQQKKPLLPDPPAIETKKLLSVLAGILLLTACMIFQRLYGGVEMLPSADVPFPEEIPSCQCSLGQEKESRYLTCCIRRSLRLQKTEPDAPYLGFTLLSVKGSTVQWNTLIAARLHVSLELYGSVDGNDMMRQLQAGRYPIARVREGGLGAFHYVLIIGAENGSYLCFDPIQRRLRPLSHYENRVYEVLYADRNRQKPGNLPSLPKNAGKSTSPLQATGRQTCSATE
ncbi:hypothetical protein [Otoolea muris]|uniref:hypothetical protein n=1 Tax=Otoolea muris TaxID=2941515 RepID=UPI00203E44B7|nr:hypothetical protein [Otoolea muris]